MVVSNIFYFHPYLGKIPYLTNIFEIAWNHQLVLDFPKRRSWLCFVLGSPNPTGLRSHDFFRVLNGDPKKVCSQMLVSSFFPISKTHTIHCIGIFACSNLLWTSTIHVGLNISYIWAKYGDLSRGHLRLCFLETPQFSFRNSAAICPDRWILWQKW